MKLNDALKNHSLLIKKNFPLPYHKSVSSKFCHVSSTTNQQTLIPSSHHNKVQLSRKLELELNQDCFNVAYSRIVSMNKWLLAVKPKGNSSESLSPKYSRGSIGLVIRGFEWRRVSLPVKQTAPPLTIQYVFSLPPSCTRVDPTRILNVLAQAAARIAIHRLRGSLIFASSSRFNRVQHSLVPF